MKQVFMLQTMGISLQKVIVQGIPSVERAVINDLGGGRYNLLVEGTNLQAVMGTEGVNATATTTNHVMEAERTLGIEAARNRIIHEINATMQAHGMSIDVRHRCVLHAHASVCARCARMCITHMPILKTTRCYWPPCVAQHAACRRHDVQGRGAGHHALRHGQDEGQCADARLL
jgi:hypothetical protein